MGALYYEDTEQVTEQVPSVFQLTHYTNLLFFTMSLFLALDIYPYVKSESRLNKKFQLFCRQVQITDPDTVELFKSFKNGPRSLGSLQEAEEAKGTL